MLMCEAPPQVGTGRYIAGEAEGQDHVAAGDGDHVTWIQHCSEPMLLREGDKLFPFLRLDGDHLLCEACTNDLVQRDACHTGAPTEGNACLWQPEWGS